MVKDWLNNFEKITYDPDKDKMRNVFCLLGIILPLCLSAQKEVEIKALYIKKYVKKDIESKLTNDSLKKTGDSYSLMIDLHFTPYFLTFEVNRISLIENDNIKHILLNNIKNVVWFKFPSFKLENKIDHSKDNYYCFPEDSLYIYQVFYVEGSAIRSTVDNDYLNMGRNINLAINWEVEPTNIDKSIPSFYIYTFREASLVAYDYSSLGFSRWGVKN